MSHGQTLETACAVCELPQDYERQRSAVMDAALFGTVPSECRRRVEEP
jgi:hypothetical protein